MTRTEAMRSPRWALSGAALCAALLLPACWPGGPIAAIAAAAGGGGGGGGGAAPLSLSGTIILGASQVTVTDLDAEPNDTLGRAPFVGLLEKPTALAGKTAFRSEEILLTRNAAGGVDLWQRELDTAPHRVRSFAPGAEFLPRLVARTATELVLVDDRAGLHVWRQKAPGSLRHDEWRAAAPGTVRGVAVVLDVLLVLVQRSGRSVLAAFDGTSGTFLWEREVAHPELVGLSGGTDLETGRPRLFAWDAAGQVLDLSPLPSGTDYRLAAPALLGSSGRDLSWSYDGLFLSAIDAAGRTQEWFDAALRSRVSAPLEVEGELLGRAGRTDLGLDGYQVSVPPGGRVDVRLWTRHSAEAGHLFLLALDRAAALSGAAALVFSTEAGPRESSPVQTLFNASAEPRTFDLVVGAVSGAARYQVLLDLPFGAEASDARAEASSSPLAGACERRVRRLGAEQRCTPYLSFLLPEHEEGRIVWEAAGAGVLDRALPLPAARRSLAEVSRSPSGLRVLGVAIDEALVAARVLSFEGSSVPASAQAERDRQHMEVLLDLRRDPAVSWCEPVVRVQALATPDDPFWNQQQWYHQALHLPAAWNVTTGFSSVVVAVVDSGVRDENIDLQPNLVAGYDFIANATDANDGDGRDPDPYDDGSPTDPTPWISHGTHVTGIAGAAGNNQIGVAGVLWTVSLMPVRAISGDTGIITDIAEGIRFAAGLSNASGTTPVQAADVINLSLGTDVFTNTLANAVGAAVNAGVTVLAAVGNDGLPSVLYPAKCPETIAIGSSTIDAQKAFYSNFGPEVDFVAPGGDATDLNMDTFPDMILSTLGSPGGVGNGTVGYQAGTSMACAAATGVVGLMRSLDTSLTPADVRTALLATATDLGTPGFDDCFGNGIINANALVNLDPPVLALPATTLDFGANGASLALQASNTGGGTLQVDQLGVTAVLGPKKWLTAKVAADGRTLLFTADRTGLADGVYQADVDVSTNGGTLTVSVLLTQSSAPLADVGTVVVEVLNASGQRVQRSTTDAAAAYAYEFRGLGTGPYTVRCGIDADQDDVLCEAGETCGEYPSVASPDLLDLTLVKPLDLDLLLEL